MRTLKHRFAKFLRDEDGLVLAEGLLMLPLVIWALVAMFIYWDVFRTINVTQKAAYGVADLLSRQRAPITPTFANGLQNVMDFLTPGGHPVKMRITSLRYNSATNNYTLLFSYSPQCKVPKLTQTQIQQWRGTRVPVLNDGDTVFVLETAVEFKAQLQTFIMGMLVGVQDETFGQFIVTRPRHQSITMSSVPVCP